MHKRSVRILALIASLVLAACGERLDGGAACPVLCSGEALALRDTVLDAIIVDTTLTGFPPRGSADLLSIANSGDSVEVRYIVRFDSLPIRYVSGTDTIPITTVGAAHSVVICSAATCRTCRSATRSSMRSRSCCWRCSR